MRRKKVNGGYVCTLVKAAQCLTWTRLPSETPNVCSDVASIKDRAGAFRKNPTMRSLLKHPNNLTCFNLGNQHDETSLMPFDVTSNPMLDWLCRRVPTSSTCHGGRSDSRVVREQT